VAGDAGGARALIPVIRKLRAHNESNVVCRAYAAALPIWEKEGFAPEAISSDVSFFERVLLGTSVNETRWESEIILKAKEEKIRTVSVLDFWINYRERFLNGKNEFVLPDVIAVMDNHAKKDMLALRFPDGCLRVTGTPALEELEKYQDPAVSDKAAEQLAEHLDLPSKSKKVLYVSQPLTELNAHRLGFTEQEAMADFSQALYELTMATGTWVSAIIKVHPRDNARAYESLPRPNSYLTWRKIREEMEPRVVVAGCDVIVGMNSMLLLEACCMGKRVLSYQPNLKVTDPLPSNQWGASLGITKKEDLTPALQSLLDGKWQPKTVPTDFRNSSDRILDLLLLKEEAYV